MADDTPDPELDRLARVVSAADWGTPVGVARPVDDDYRVAAAVLADLRERYILVPHDGAIVEMRLKGAATVLDPAVAAMLARPGDEFERRDVGPWEPAP